MHIDGTKARIRAIEKRGNVIYTYPFDLFEPFRRLLSSRRLDLWHCYWPVKCPDEVNNDDSAKSSNLSDIVAVTRLEVRNIIWELGIMEFSVSGGRYSKSYVSPWNHVPNLWYSRLKNNLLSLLRAYISARVQTHANMLRASWAIEIIHYTLEIQLTMPVPWEALIPFGTQISIYYSRYCYLWCFTGLVTVMFGTAGTLLGISKRAQNQGKVLPIWIFYSSIQILSVLSIAPQV